MCSLVIHTQLLNNKLEFELEEEKNSCKKLQHQMELVQSDLTQGLKDKHDMLDVLTAKVNINILRLGD